MGKKFLALIITAMGFLFTFAYIRSASANVVYTDYIRLVNSYLKDVYSFKPYMGADIFTRMPISYIQRIVNVKCFSYSTMFDMMLGAFFLSVSVFFILYYAAKRNASYAFISFLAFIGFSLNKWEMLINGSGWVHFLAFAMFSYHFYIYDRLLEQDGVLKPKKIPGYSHDMRAVIILPYTMLLFSGPYIMIYALAISAVYIINIILSCGKIKKYSVQGKADNELYRMNINTLKTHIRAHIIWLINVIAPTMIYIYSRINSVEEHAGATNLPFTKVISDDPLLLLRLLLKSFASVIFDNEVVKKAGLSDTLLFLTGILIGIFYIYALYLNFYKGVFKISIFPACLLFAGGASHLLVVMSRWIFLKDTYAMSSRYALQFQSGTFGILLTLFIYKKYIAAAGLKAYTEAVQNMSDKNIFSKKISDKKQGNVFNALCTNINIYAFCIIIISYMLGNIITYSNEIRMSVYRKENFISMQEAALNYTRLSDDELTKIFQYHDPVRIKKALKILQDKGLNVFKPEKRITESQN